MEEDQEETETKNGALKNLFSPSMDRIVDCIAMGINIVKIKYLNKSSKYR